MLTGIFIGIFISIFALLCTVIWIIHWLDKLYLYVEKIQDAVLILLREKTDGS